MVKKIISLSMILVMLFNAAACGKKAPEDVTMPAPDKLSKDVPITVLDSGLKLYDGYLCKEHNGRYEYFPYVADKVDGVMYADDALSVSAEEESYRKSKEKICKEYNKPAGCDSLSEANSQCWMFETGGSATPEFAHIVRTEEGEKWRTLYIHRNYTTFAGSYGAGAVYDTSVKLRDVDVQAVSFALYEDFYEEVPQLTVEIYAVTKEVAKKKLGDTYKQGEANDIIDNYSKDYSEFELVTSQKINNTGVYYIDWKSIDSNEDYLFYIIALDWAYVSDCAYYIDGSNVYDIEDEAVYLDWKKANKDKFLAG